MSDYNQMIISGMITNAPETRTSVNSIPYSFANMVHKQKDKNKEKNNFFKILAFGNISTELENLKNGDSVMVIGRFSPSFYDKEGKQSVSLQIIASKVIKMKDSDKESQEEFDVLKDDEIPF